jgi:general secretion pathway protein G
MKVVSRSKRGCRFRLLPGAGEDGYSLVELVAVAVIIGILASAVIPLTKISVKRAKEIELHRVLREMRRAIDLYKKMADEKKIEVEDEVTGTGYPPNLEILIEGAKLTGETDRVFKFLRRIPVDPMTGEREWGLRGSQDEPESDSWDGEDVFDVYSLSEATALDGTNYRDW